MKKPSKYWIIAGTFFTSLSSIIIRFSEAPALAMAAYRMLFTTMMIALPVFMNNRSEFKSLSKKCYIMCVISGVFLAFHYAFWMQSIQRTTIANSTVLVSSSPIFVALFNYLLLKEKFNKRMILGIAASMAGTIIIAMGSSGGAQSSMMLGNFFAFLGAIFVAGYLVIGGIARKSASAGVYVFLVYSVSAIILFAMNFATGTPIYPYAPIEFLLFFLLAFCSSILGHTVYNYLVKYYSSTLISVSTLGEPIYASILAMLIFKELPSAYTIIGGIIVISGIYYYLATQNAADKDKKNISLP